MKSGVSLRIVNYVQERDGRLQAAGGVARQDDQGDKSAYDMAVRLSLRKKSIFAD